MDFQRRDPKQASRGARSRSIPRAGLSRYGGRHHLVMVGDIIPLRWATSSRFGGRLGQESAGFSVLTISGLSRGFSTCCLRFKNGVATTHAKLASGWLARLYREGVEPSRSLQKVSDHTLVPLFWIYPGATYGGFSPVGWKAGLSGRAFPDGRQLKSAPDIRCPSAWFAATLRTLRDRPKSHPESGDRPDNVSPLG